MKSDNFRLRVLSMLFLSFTIPIAGFAQRTSHPSSSGDLTATLRAKDESLLNAVHRGDRNAWSDATTSDFMYIEDGEIQKREAFLKDLEEDGLKPLIIRAYDVRLNGDTAVVTHFDDLPERANRITTSSRFLMTEVWQRLGNNWKLRLVDINRLRVDPPEISLSTSELDQLVGTYTSGTDTYVIQRTEDRLSGLRNGTKKEEMKAEVRDVWFVPGQVRNRKIFRRDANDHIVGFVDRNEFSDRIWTKVSQERN